MPLDVLATLQALVRLPSVNPMGRNDEGDIYYEHRVTNFLDNLFHDWRLPCERWGVHTGRDNILVRLDGALAPPEHGGPLLMWEVHQDTVPVEGMTIDPFAAELREGRVYGRGACDIKGAMAAMLAALRQLAESPGAARPTIVLACTINEEHGFTGATNLANLWKSGGSRLLPRAPDAVLVAEPTELNVVVAHKGVVRWRCHTRGRAVHSSAPERGENAIYRMARVLQALEQYARDVVPPLAEHRLLGRPSLSVGTIEGGLSVNTVPDACRIEIDRRLMPGEDPLAAQRHVIDHVARATGLSSEQVTHEPPMIVSPGLGDDRNGGLAARVRRAGERLGLAPQTLGVPFGTDAAALAIDNVPCVVFGPGSIAQAHTEDEWVELAQVEQARDLLAQLARDWE